MNVARARNHVQMEIAPHYYFEWPDEDEGHSIERCLEALGGWYAIVMSPALPRSLR